jgi:hypothetical protein
MCLAGSFPSLEGRGLGWVGERSETFPASEFRPPSADPPPAPPFQGGEAKRLPLAVNLR